MKAKKIYIIVAIIMIIVINISIVASAQGSSSNTGAQNKIIYKVSNKKDFCTMLPYCINNNIPLIISSSNDGAISNFSKSYNGNIVNLESNSVLTFIKNEYNKDTLIISTENDSKIVILGGQIACNLNCPIIYEKDITDFFHNNSNEYKKIIILGDVNFSNKSNSELYKYKTFQDVQRLYNESINNSNLNVYIENNDYDIFGLYLAAYRKGKIYFDTKNIEDMNRYFAWIIKPQDFLPDKYLDLYSSIEKRSSYNYDKGIGVITGITSEDVILMLLRSFFYNNLEKSKNILDIESLVKKKNYSVRSSNGDYNIIGNPSNNLEDVLKKMHASKYIRILGHGSYNKIEMGNKIYLNTDNFPMLDSSLVIAESCSTCEQLDGDSIALKAIENGAVAYIGSIKTGGVESPFISQPYLISTEEIPLSNLVLANNVEIKKYEDNSIRAVLIGDPLWSMYKNIGTWNSDGSYQYSLPYTFNFKYAIPLKIQGTFNANSVIITKNESTSKNSNTIFRKVKLGNTNIIFVNSSEIQGNIQFTNKIIFKQFINKLLNDYLQVMDTYVNGFLIISFVNIIQIIFCIAVLFYIFKTRGEIKILNKRIIIAILDAIILYFIVNLLYDIGINYLLFIYFILLFYLLFILYNSKYNVLIASINTIIPIYILLLIFNFNIYLCVYLLPAMFTFILIQLCIYFFTNKIYKRLKNTFFKKNVEQQINS